ncbi:diacylglycerol/lipid kinase family protein [Paenibacillus dendritiformis]|uniref:diacylglycerol/lipid kinase family protein n=1 Tax=Paenibacillus dendritiformis TaxID=130049 RepID=UPI00105A6EF2|nr:diacylglycerol kinase family protein [Paenibacillus dendritiformis]TDL49746.1 diacylglycerol kinase family lipid kinase [Paenibacillus dendritiformis]
MYLFIVNRISGNGKGIKTWRKIEPLLQNKQVHYKVEFSDSPSHAALLVRQYMIEHDKMKAFVIVGGDGTIQSVAHEIAESNIPLGIIPAGSGNDLARGLHIPLNAKKALEYLLTGTTKKIDIARIGSKCYTTVVGIGIDGKVAQTVNLSRYKKWFNHLKMGNLSYIFSFIQVLLRYKPANVHITVDGKEMIFSDVWLIAVANLPNYAGGMKICPEACYTDGFFHICIVQGTSRWTLMKIFPDVFRGNHIFHPAVTTLRGRKVEVYTESPMIAHGDGEMIGETPLEVTVYQDAIHVIYNPQLAEELQPCHQL